ncbi:MAG: hypothetical protein FJZ01_03325 [Candidatus Sericytochromatia bacterium]|nr:hypothetical protein [Candidatus Tanganyikabacteria bacterium]
MWFSRRAPATQADIDLAIARWAETRDRELAREIRERGWRASGPLDLRILAHLKFGLADPWASPGPRIVPFLLWALNDPEGDVRAAAWAYLMRLRSHEAMELVALLWERPERGTRPNPSWFPGPVPRVESFLDGAGTERLLAGGPVVVVPLLRLVGSAEPALAERGRRILSRLERRDAWNALCDWWVRTADPTAGDVIAASRRSAFFAGAGDEAPGFGREDQETWKLAVSVLTRSRARRNVTLTLAELDALLAYGHRFRGAVWDTWLGLLGTLGEQPLIDRVCEAWVAEKSEARRDALEDAIVEGGYVASGQATGSDGTRDMRPRVFTALLNGCHRLLGTLGPEGVPALLAALEVPRLAVSARRALLRLTDPRASDVLCRLALHEDHPEAQRTVQAAAYLPSVPEERALHLFLLGTPETFAGCDPQGERLGAALQACPERLRARACEQALRTLSLPWVAAVARPQEGRRAPDLTAAEWEVAFALLWRAGAPGEAWRLSRQAPVVWARRALGPLAELDWLPAEPADRAAYVKVRDLAGACEGLPPLLLDPSAPPLRLRGHKAPVVGLAFGPDGGVLASWAEDGHVRAWDAVSGERLGTWTQGGAPVVRLAFSPDGQRIAWLAGDQLLVAWVGAAAAGRKPLAIPVRGNGQHFAAFAWVGSDRLATAGPGGRLASWSADSGKAQPGAPVAVGFRDADASPVSADLAGLLPDERVVVRGASGSVGVYRPGSATPQASVRGFPADVEAVAIGQLSLAASASGVSAICLWPSPAGRLWTVAADRVRWPELRCLEAALRGGGLAGADRAWVELALALASGRMTCDVGLDTRERVPAGEGTDVAL